MNFIINETKEYKELNYFESKCSSKDCMEDILFSAGVVGGCVNSENWRDVDYDKYMYYDDDLEVYRISQALYVGWCEYIADLVADDAEREELIETYDSKAVWQIISDTWWYGDNYNIRYTLNQEHFDLLRSKYLHIYGPERVFRVLDRTWHGYDYNMHHAINKKAFERCRTEL